MNTKTMLAAALAVAASITAASAANFSTTTVGTVNGNGKTILDATGDTVNDTTFATDMATAFANDTGGVWNFDTSGFTVNNGETVTLSYGTSQSTSEVLTIGQGASDNINQGTVPGEATSGSSELGLGSSAGTRTFTFSTPLVEFGIFNTNRGDASRIPSVTVTFLDTTTATTSGANAGATYFHGFKTTSANPIVSASISQNNFIRYDDMGFVVAVPEPTTFAFLVGGVGMLALLRRRRA